MIKLNLTYVRGISSPNIVTRMITIRDLQDKYRQLGDIGSVNLIQQEREAYWMEAMGEK